MKTTYQKRMNGKNGVALVIVLGLLSVLTTLAVAFAIAMRVEQMASQNFADAVRAEHLAHAGIARAMEAVQKSMTAPSLTYPRWLDSGGTLVEAMVSTNPAASAAKCTDLLTGEVAAAIPGYVKDYNGTETVVNNECRWTNIVDTVGGRTNRIAYAIFNNSGLLDANFIGGTNRVWSESLREIDVHKIPGIITNQFFTNRIADVRYETLPELLALQAMAPAGLDSSATRDLYTFSYDPGRDECFTNNAARTNKLGIATTNDLRLKFNINSLITETATNKIRATNILYEAGLKYKTDDVFWNLVNWVDADRYPTNDPAGNPAYVSTEGGEALPLINEIVLEKVATPTETNCQFAVELWYPFVVEHETWTSTGSANYSLKIDTNPKGGTVDVDIPPMAYGTTNEFRVYRSNVMLGLTGSVRVVVFEGATTDSGRRPVDAAMNRNGGLSRTDPWSVVVATDFTNGFKSFEVDDPRSNGKPNYWKNCLTSNTLGRMNSISDPWGTKWTNTFDRQGLPIYVKNGPMENVGEMGYIPLANRENHSPALPEVKHYWCTIDLLSRDEGARLLDYITVYPTNRSGHGFVTINTRDEETLKALFTEMKIGWKNTETNAFRPIHVEDSADDTLVNAVVSKIIERTEGRPQGAISFADLFEGPDYTESGVAMPGGPVAKAFRAFGPWWAAKTGLKDNDKVREDAFRNIIELITFRQNIFTIAVAAQIMAPNGKTVDAEKRALATVYRDSYTGDYFVRSFKWMK